jgi:uncharacterized membrane protein
MKTRAIGKIQFAVGIIFLTLILISGAIIVKINFDNFMKGIESVSKAYNELKNSPNVDLKSSGHVFDSAYHGFLGTLIIYTSGALFVMQVLTAIILSMLLIFQGLDKIKK